MPTNVLVWCLASGMLFGAFVVVMKASGLHPLLAAVVFHVGSLFILFPLLIKNAPRISWVAAGIAIGLVGGIIHGFGHTFYQQIIALKGAGLTQAITVVIAAQILVIATFSGIFYGEEFGWKKILGCALALLAVKLLTGK